jgi:hypothetical protein
MIPPPGQMPSIPKTSDDAAEYAEDNVDQSAVAAPLHHFTRKPSRDKPHNNPVNKSHFPYPIFLFETFLADIGLGELENGSHLPLKQTRLQAEQNPTAQDVLSPGRSYYRIAALCDLMDLA